MGSSKMSQNNIPSEEDFARAKAYMEELDAGFDKVSENIKKHYGKDNVHKVFLFYSPKIDTFGAYVFFLKNDQVDEAKKSGLSSQIEEAIRNELENVGRGDRNLLKLNVEFDSHENVEKDYEGDYYDRLR